MGLRYRIPLPGPFYCSGRVGPKHWLPRSSHTGPSPMGFIVKWFIVYPGVALFGAGLVILLAPFYGLFWVVRRSLRNRWKCRLYGFVPAQRERVTVGGEPFGSDRYV